MLRARADLPWLPARELRRPDGLRQPPARPAQPAASTGGSPTSCTPTTGWWRGPATPCTRCTDVPLVATIHATERGRNGGHVPPGQPAAINAVEWWLTYQANQVIACSRYMVDEIVAGFDLPTDKIDQVPNGVDPVVWAPPSPAPARGEGGPLVVTWGRVQYEKGFQYLIEAMASLRTARTRRPPRHRRPGLATSAELRGAWPSSLGVADIVRVRRLRPRRRAAGAAPPRRRAPSSRRSTSPSASSPSRRWPPRRPVVAAAAGGMAEVLEGTGAGLLVPAGRCRVTLVRRRAVAHRTGARRVVTGGRHPAGRGAVLLGRHRHRDRRDVSAELVAGPKLRVHTPRLASQAYEGAPQLHRPPDPARSRWPRSSGWP